jgi:hypothetical protein
VKWVDEAIIGCDEDIAKVVNNSNHPIQNKLLLVT